MLLEPEEFVKLCKKHGCTRNEFDETSNNLSNKLHIVQHFKAVGQDTYYKLNLAAGILEVVTRGEKFVIDSNEYYCEAFKTIRYLSH